MEDLLRGGVVAGFSGGADSITLLLCLAEYRRTHGDFPIFAAHLNHGIRGADADADEALCAAYCRASEIPFFSEKADVRELSRERKMGQEEVGRELRYAFFDEVCKETGARCVAVAHNGTDQTETVIHHLLRGSGTRGLCGMRPVRGRIIRPLLEVSKADIVRFLEGFSLPYAKDFTNDDLSYTRNFIRHEILPKLAQVTTSLDVSTARLSRNLCADEEYLCAVARDYLDAHRERITRVGLLALHPAIFARVLFALSDKAGGEVPEQIHVDLIRERLKAAGDFSLDLPGKKSFFCEGDVCSIRQKQKDDEGERGECMLPVRPGENSYPEYGVRLILGDTPITENSANVYKIVMQGDFSSAIIDGELYLRTKRDADAYFYAGMHHKIKKVLLEKRIPKHLRDRVPVICDRRGIVWIPGLPPRDDSTGIRRGRGPYLTVQFIGCPGGFFPLPEREARMTTEKGIGKK